MRGKKKEQALIPAAALTSLKWWKKLSDIEQKEVLSEGQQLAVAMIQHGQSRIAIGQHLARLQEILTPHGLFGRFLRTLHFSERTAKRYVASFKNAKLALPDNVLKLALARGVNIMGESDEKPFGQYTEAVKQLPPPQNANEQQAGAWLTAIENQRKQQRSQTATEASGGEILGVLVPQDPQTLLKECFRFFVLRYNRLPHNMNTRRKFVRTLVGMELSVAGETAGTFNPVAVPSDFTVGRGRPKEKLAATA